MMLTRRLLVLIAALVTVGPVPVNGQVTANGFAVKHEVRIAAPSAKVYDALVGQVGKWWSPAHTYSGDANNLSIDPRPGGCFCERLANGGGVEHLRVVYVAPGDQLRMSGALGPLQASGLAGSLTWKLTNAGNGSTIELSYVVGGYMSGGFEQMAPAVSGVLLEQLTRLKSFVETGTPTP
jgi:uncharacterized protein YndB with AHSA1/START domain